MKIDELLKVIPDEEYISIVDEAKEGISALYIGGKVGVSAVEAARVLLIENGDRWEVVKITSTNLGRASLRIIVREVKIKDQMREFEKDQESQKRKELEIFWQEYSNDMNYHLFEEGSTNTKEKEGLR